MQNKRGQVTLFIIIAIVLVGAVGLYLSLSGKIGGATPTEVEEVYVFVQECIENTGEEAVFEISKNGGYYIAPDFSIDNGIPYYYAEGISYMPSKEDVAQSLSRYINDALFFCTRGFADFTEYQIDEEDVQTTTEIQDEKVILNIEYPLRISKGENIYQLRDFKDIEVNVRLGVIYDSVAQIITDQLTQEDICLSCILDITLENDLYVDMVDYDDETVVFIVRDETVEMEGVFLEYIFANKYVAQA